MTVTVSISTVTNSIAALTISGVSILDIDQMGASYIARPALLAPRPDNFISGLTVMPTSFGAGSSRQVNLSYTLNYYYYHCQIGSALDFPNHSALVTNIAAILVALMTTDDVTGATDILPSVGDVGVITDPAGNSYIGCSVTIQVTEYVNGNKISAKDAIIWVDNSSGTPVNITADVESYSIEYDYKPIDVTTLDNTGHNFLGGWTVSTITLFPFFNQTATTGVWTVLQGGFGSARTVKILPAGTGAYFSGEFLCQNLPTSGKMNDEARMNGVKFIPTGSTAPSWSSS